MPGAYAHITLVNELCNSRLAETLLSETPDALPAIRDYLNYCELGAVSPDYPNLDQNSGCSGEWADAMHYARTGQMIHKGIEHVRSQGGETKHKLLAWLLGYAAHVVTDTAIHPVVLCKVGDYAQNVERHRICEMNQDAHVFRRMGLGEIGESGILSWRVAECGDPGELARMDGDIERLWRSMFREVHQELYAANPPLINDWYKGFIDRIDHGNDDDYRLFPLARVISTRLDGMPYPRHDAVDRQFVERLRTPDGSLLDYDDIFEKAIAHVAEVWGVVARGVFADDESYLTRLGDWDLDTGRDHGGRLVFWG